MNFASAPSSFAMSSAWRFPSKGRRPNTDRRYAPGFTETLPASRGWPDLSQPISATLSFGASRRNAPPRDSNSRSSPEGRGSFANTSIRYFTGSSVIRKKTWAERARGSSCRSRMSCSSPAGNATVASPNVTTPDSEETSIRALIRASGAGDYASLITSAPPPRRKGSARSTNRSGVSTAIKWPELASTYFAPGIWAATFATIAGVRIPS